MNLDILNITIAVIALVVSVLAIYYSRVQYRQEEIIRAKAELVNILKVFNKFERLVEEVRAERLRTKAKLADHEHQLFESFTYLIAMQHEIVADIKIILEKKKIKTSHQVIPAALVLSSKTESFIETLEKLRTKFQKYNESKHLEFREKVEKSLIEFEKLKPKVLAIITATNKQA